ncbi:MAG: polysaccharide biosynthesis/export family protein [Rhodobacteraceae bacterium]|nr:polysaccharide biosynthesis/export family protein [Paracoccaceae bacterium]
MRLICLTAACVVFSGGLIASLAHADEYPIMAGDELKVDFFDRPPEGAETASLYKRNDLSGNYPVSSGGMITLPILGSLTVEDLTLEDVSKKLQDLSDSVSDDGLVVRTNFGARPPVYVKGKVVAPGAYRYLPNMNVAQLVALASGYSRDAEASTKLPAMTARLDLSENEAKLTTLIVRKARLEALYDDHEKITMPEELISLVGTERAQVLLDKEQAVHTRALTLWREGQALHRTRIEIADANARAFAEVVDVADEQEQAAQARFEKWDAVYQPKYFSVSPKANTARTRDANTYFEIRRKNSEARAQLQKALSEYSAAKSSLAESRITRLNDLSRQIDEITDQIQTTSTLLQKAEGTLRVLKVDDGRQGKKDTGSRVTIQRIADGQAQMIKADEATRVRPGDIIEVAL